VGDESLPPVAFSLPDRKSSYNTADGGRCQKAEKPAHQLEDRQGMGLLQTLRRHAAVAGGNFAAMFREVTIPPLPAAVARLLAEIQRPEPDIARLELMLAAEPEIAARVIRTVNSAASGLRRPVHGVRQAVTLLGLERTRSLILSYAVLENLPTPAKGLFDHEAYWTDSLGRALLARLLARRSTPAQEEEAFTAALLADVALPVLLTAWREYYTPVVERWQGAPERLSELEQSDFGWDHAQAGAWILQYWDFPEALVELVAAHTRDQQSIVSAGLAHTCAPAIATAALLPSVLKPDGDRVQRLLSAGSDGLGLSAGDWAPLLEETRTAFAAVCSQFDIARSRTDALWQVLAASGLPTEALP
jgi:HD-like signal output (HDOD) protein